MAENQHITPKLSERFSGLFGVEDPSLELSLDSDPKTIYIEESRKLNLNKLLHLAPYSEVLLLLGEPAVGRTSLLKAFVERAATTWRISFVTATAVMDGESFLRQVGQGFDHDLSDFESTSDLLWELDRYLQALGRSGRRAMIIVDDAHLLTDDVILLAEKILRDERTDNSVSLIMSMRKDQANKLDRFALLKESLAYTLTLEPFSQKEVDGYLRHRMSATVPQLNELLSPELVADIHRKSGGMPEEVNALAHGLLTKKAKSGVSTDSRRSPLKLVAIVLAAFVVGGVLYYQDEINQVFVVPAGQVQTASDESDSPEAIDTADARALKAIDAVLQQTPVVAGLEDAEGKPVPILHEEVELIVDDLPVVDASLEPETVALEEEPAVKGDADEEAEVSVKPEPQVASQPEPKPVPPAKVEPVVPAELVWLMAQPGSHYTMQMMALVDKAKVLRFVKRHKIADQSAVYPISRRGKLLTVLVYGSYASRAEADKAAKALPKSWGVGQPWIRSFADARKDLQSK